MIPVEPFFQALASQGVTFYTGVPDSLLKNFCSYVTDHAAHHVIAANEGNAVALAAGHYLATGKPALVYMQNSGLGNAVNPLLSLTDPDVYSIPMVLLVGWRGEPGVKDEPQHRKQGEVSRALLDAVQVPHFVLDADSGWAGLVSQALKKAVAEKRPVALLVRANTFDAYKLKSKVESSYPMVREEAIRAILASHPEWFFVSTTGYTSRELFEIREKAGQSHEQDFLTVGSMGHSLQIALGMVLSGTTKTVCCLDGDGAVLMQMGGLAVAAQSGQPLVHVLLNNGCHDSVGGQPTVGHAVNFQALASALGYRQSLSVSTLADLQKALGSLNREGPVFLEIKLKGGARSDLGRPTTSTGENRDAFMRALGSLK